MQALSVTRDMPLTEFGILRRSLLNLFQPQHHRCTRLAVVMIVYSIFCLPGAILETTGRFSEGFRIFQPLYLPIMVRIY